MGGALLDDDEFAALEGADGGGGQPQGVLLALQDDGDAHQVAGFHCDAGQVHGQVGGAVRLFQARGAAAGAVGIGQGADDAGQLLPRIFDRDTGRGLALAQAAHLLGGQLGGDFQFGGVGDDEDRFEGFDRVAGGDVHGHHLAVEGGQDEGIGNLGLQVGQVQFGAGHGLLQAGVHALLQAFHFELGQRHPLLLALDVVGVLRRLLNGPVVGGLGPGVG